MQVAERKIWNEADYLAYEESATARHEFVAGEVYAMSGGSRRHNRIALNLAASLLAQLADRPCQVAINDVKLHVAHDAAYYYPDVMVGCGDGFTSADSANFVESAQLVVEVLSPSTEATDRREKLHAYRKVPGIVEYALVSQSERRVEVYRRQGDVGWLYIVYEPGDTVEFTSVDASLTMDDLYAGTDPDPPEAV